jgi:predicted acetyltransferase
VDIEIRPVGLDRFQEVMRTLSVAFGEELDRGELEDERPSFDTGRNLAAFEGETMVGHASVYPMELSVPGGGMLPVAAVTSVGVLPTHRRRGIARSLMRRHLDADHEAGIPLSYLWASENAIYQRFGYGIGSLAAAFEIRRQDTAFLRPMEPLGRIRLVDRQEALKVFPSVYERVLPVRAGMLTRDEAWWNIRFRDTERSREGASPFFFVVYETPEGIDGYAAYRIKEGWDHRTGPGHRLQLEEHMAATVDAAAAVWRYCFEVDLVQTVEGWKRPPDEPLLVMLENSRALGLRVRDGTWLRIVDVPTALAGRSYGREGRLILELEDDFCDWNAGRWELEGGPDGATCRRTDAEPDLVLGAGELASMFLGAIRPSVLAEAGRLAELTDGSLHRADAMFGTDLAPWCAHIF